MPELLDEELLFPLDELLDAELLDELWPLEELLEDELLEDGLLEYALVEALLEDELLDDEPLEELPPDTLMEAILALPLPDAQNPNDTVPPLGAMAAFQLAGVTVIEPVAWLEVAFHNCDMVEPFVLRKTCHVTIALELGLVSATLLQ